MFEHLPQKDKTSLLEKKAMIFGPFFLRWIVRFGVISLLSAYTLEHMDETQRSRDFVQVEKIKDDYGNYREVFHHSDKETNHIIRLILGYDSLSTDEISAIKKYLEISSENDTEKNSVGIKIQNMQKTFAQDPLPEELQKKFWEVLIECGSPKIHFMITGEESSISFFAKDTYHYNPLEHTIYLPITKSIFGPITSTNGVIAELTHAYQFSNNTLGIIPKVAKDFSGALNRTIDREILEAMFPPFVTGPQKTFLENLQNENLKTYDDKRSFEYIAHQKLEPLFREKLEGVLSYNKQRSRTRKTPEK